MLLSATTARDPAESGPAIDRARTARSNLFWELAFCVFNAIFAGMIVYGAPVILLVCLGGTANHLAVLVCAFPCGAFLGPLWAKLGRAWGMQRLVIRMTLMGALPGFLVPWVDQVPGWSAATVFTALMATSHLLYSAMRMGQSNLYRATYPLAERGRAIGWLLFASFLTMVPTVQAAGWLVDQRFGNPENYRWLFPLAGALAMVGTWFYARIRLLEPFDTGRPTTWRAAVADLHRVFHQDRVYMLFQLGFFLSGSAFFMANHIVLKLSEDRLDFHARELALVTAVIPQLTLAITSPIWGKVLDRLGIMHLRLLISITMTIYMACFFGGLWWSIPWLMFLGAVLRGMSEGAGQVTWALASVQFAPRSEDVPVYSSIHFTLNGLRGLVMPWIGTLLLPLMGVNTVLVAAGVAASSIFVGLRLTQLPEPQSLHPKVLPNPTAEVEPEPPPTVLLREEDEDPGPTPVLEAANAATRG
jgi:MFS family permease